MGLTLLLPGFELAGAGAVKIRGRCCNKEIQYSQSNTGKLKPVQQQTQILAAENSNSGWAWTLNFRVGKG